MHQRCPDWFGSVCGESWAVTTVGWSKWSRVGGKKVDVHGERRNRSKG